MKKNLNVMTIFKNRIMFFVECHDIRFFIKFTFCFIIIVLTACVSLHAGEGIIFYGNAKIAGKEYIHVKGDPASDTTSQAQVAQQEISFNESPYIFITENALINGKEHLIVKKNTSPLQEVQISITETENESPSPAKDNIIEVEEAHPVIILPDFPFVPSSYFQSGRESAMAVSHQNPGRDQPACKANRKKTFPDIENSNLSLYLPRQRQKLSTTAIQCGILTSFSPNSPTLS